MHRRVKEYPVELPQGNPIVTFAATPCHRRRQSRHFDCFIYIRRYGEPLTEWSILETGVERYAQVCDHIASLLRLNEGDHRKGQGSQIRLDSSLNIASTSILRELGLSMRCGSADPSFEAQLKRDEERRNSDWKTQNDQDQKDIKQRIQALSHSLPFWLVHQTARHYP